MMRLVLVVVFGCAIPCFADTLYVDDSAASGGNGLAWGTAFNDLQDALDAARLDSSIDAIHVAAGEYRPDRGTLDASIRFEHVDGVSLLGGFPDGGGTLGERDAALHETILTGDLLGDDVGPDANGFLSGLSDNTRHLVRIVNCGATTITDGFTLRGGNADGFTREERSGAAMQVTGGSPVVRKCRFERSQTEWGGGGIGVIDSSPLIESCVFEENITYGVGGGIAIFGTQPADIRECRFLANIGGTGVGIYCGPIDLVSDDPGNATTIQDCEFRDNNGKISATAGGGILVKGGDNAILGCRFVDNRANGGGGVYVEGGEALIERCVFHGNQGDGDGGGAIAVIDFGAASPVNTTEVVSCLIAGNNGAFIGVNNNIHLINCTVVHNQFPGLPSFLTWPAFWSQNAVFTIDNSIVWGNLDNDFNGDERDFLMGSTAYTVHASIIEKWAGVLAGSAIPDDPTFVDGDGTDDDPFTPEDNNYRPRFSSPGIDAGDDLALPSGSVLDVDRGPRFADANSDTVATVDIGAYERCRVDLNGDGVGDELDAIVLLDALLAPVPAALTGDLDGDGVLDGADVCPASPCGEVFVDGRPALDMNADCGLDGRDIQAFVEQLPAGCGP